MTVQTSANLDPWPEPSGPRPDVALPEGYVWSTRRPRHHGSIEIGPPQRVAGDRRVLRVPGRAWAHTPEACRDETGTGEWVLPEVLVCRGCGLDST